MHGKISEIWSGVWIHKEFIAALIDRGGSWITEVLRIKEDWKAQIEEDMRERN